MVPNRSYVFLPLNNIKGYSPGSLRVLALGGILSGSLRVMPLGGFLSGSLRDMPLGGFFSGSLRVMPLGGIFPSSLSFIQPFQGIFSCSSRIIPVGEGIYPSSLRVVLFEGLLPCCQYTTADNFPLSALVVQKVYAIISGLSSILFSMIELLSKVWFFNQNFVLMWVSSSAKGWNTIQLVQLSMCRHLYLQHDFIVLFKKVMHKILLLQVRAQIIASSAHPCLLFILIIADLLLRKKKKKKKTLLYKFRLTHRSSLIFGILRQQVKEMNTKLNNKNILQQKSDQLNIGGYSSPVFTFEFLEPYVISDIAKINTSAHFRYTDYVHDIKLSQYPANQYILTIIPLHVLCKMLPISKARKVAFLHGLKVGSKCSIAHLLESVAGHSCVTCAKYLCVFIANKNSAQLHVDSVIKSRKKQAAASKSKKHLSNTDINLNAEKSLQPTSDFPPHISDQNLCHTIISSACKKMNKVNIEEAGCSVCGELKPLKNLSNVKNIKNMLHILTTPGVTRIERKNCNSPVHEYSGPVLDYTCSKVCDHCRSSIRNGKVPRLALANNLWLGRVPEELKTLRFVEKLLIARVRHTCSYVKVASGMRKMKANIIAFESPIPKIYDVLPPPRDDMDDVLAILLLDLVNLLQMN